MRPVESIQFQKKSERAKSKTDQTFGSPRKKIPIKEPLDIDALMANLTQMGIPLKLDDIDL